MNSNALSSRLFTWKSFLCSHLQPYKHMVTVQSEWKEMMTFIADWQVHLFNGSSTASVAVLVASLSQSDENHYRWLAEGQKLQSLLQSCLRWSYLSAAAYWCSPYWFVELHITWWQLWPCWVPVFPSARSLISDGQVSVNRSEPQLLAVCVSCLCSLFVLAVCVSCFSHFPW